MEAGVALGDNHVQEGRQLGEDIAGNALGYGRYTMGGG
jgi:hypothetical protein